MDGDKKLGVAGAGEAGAFAEFDEAVVLAGQVDLDFGVGLADAVGELFGDGEGQRFLVGLAVGADGAGVLAAVAGIDDDAVEAEFGDGVVSLGKVLMSVPPW